MTEHAARAWLSSHHDIIPALEVQHRKARDILEDHSKTLGDLADVIALDPGMSISLLHEVSAKLQRSGKQSTVESVQAALGLLGDGAIVDLVMQHKVLDDDHPQAVLRQSYHQLVSRVYHLLAQLESFVSLQGIREINEIRTAALLHSVGEYCACLFENDKYQKYLEKYRLVGIGANSAKSVFGFSFHELGRHYAEKAGLPRLVTESLDENIPPGRKARLIQLAADISHQAEIGWNHSAMKATEEVSAAYLNRSIGGFDKHLQQVAIEAARNCPIADVMPAASRLIMLPEREVSSAAKAAADDSPGDKGRKFETRVKSLLRLPRTSQAQLLELLLSHLHDDLHLSRVVLMLSSADGSKLGTRAGRGLDQLSPIRTLVLDISKAGLLKTLMSKPQALWVDPETYPKYEAALSPKFKASFLHENFFLMSLFVADRPIGLVFCDRALSINKLDKTCYLQFKSAMLLTGMGLTYLANRKQGALA